MIVDAGKQFWNDFNNGDEALFQDADRPRDNDKFKLRPWLQAQKNDLRTANSWIAAQWLFKGAKLQAWQDYVRDANGNWLMNTAYMKSSYTASDFSDIDWFVATDGTVITASAIVDWLTINEKGQKEQPIIWKPYVNPVDWDIVIWRSGLYSITCQVTFIAPTWYNVSSTTFSSSSAFYKFYVALMLNWKASMHTQSRWCGTTDALSVSLTARFDTWDVVNTGFLHTYKTNPFLCQPSIVLYRLS